GPLERCEGVDTLPGSWGEITPGSQKTPVEVALRPQERQVRPRGSDMVGHPPGLPGTVLVRVLTEWFDDPAGGLLQQRCEPFEVFGGQRKGVADLADQCWVSFVQHTPGERSGNLAGD